jgi:hypothetical protein
MPSFSMKFTPNALIININKNLIAPSKKYINLSTINLKCALVFINDKLVPAEIIYTIEILALRKKS